MQRIVPAHGALMSDSPPSEFGTFSWDGSCLRNLTEGEAPLVPRLEENFLVVTSDTNFQMRMSRERRFETVLHFSLREQTIFLDASACLGCAPKRFAESQVALPKVSTDRKCKNQTLHALKKNYAKISRDENEKMSKRTDVYS